MPPLSTTVTVEGGRPEAGRDRLAAACYPLYRRLFREDSRFAADVARKLAASRMTATVEMYLSRALGVGVLAGLVLWLLGAALGHALFATGAVELSRPVGFSVPSRTLVAAWEAVEVPLLVFVTGVLFGSVGFALGFGTYVVIPYSRAAARRREINMLLSDSVSYMYSLSVGGLNQIEILHEMSRADDSYGEVAREFQSIVQETEYFDTDYRTAIRKQAIETPSEELGQFLTDMLSIINSGGDMGLFLDDQKDKFMRTAKRQQAEILETLELFGEMYMTLSLFPLLLIVVLVIMSLLGDADPFMLYLAVYGLIPLTGLGFLVLVATFKWDEPGDGYLHLDDDQDLLLGVSRTGLFNRGVVEAFAGSARVFDRIKDREGSLELIRFLRQPHVFFRDHPAYSFAVTVPATVAIVAAAVLTGSAPTSWAELVARSVWGTFVYVYLPVYLILAPFAAFHTWNIYARRAVTANLSNDLRKLSSANDTGLTLLESVRLVAETSTGKLATEFEIIYAKVKYGMSLTEALVAFNNAYHLPNLARTVRLITKAQEASNHITAVLRTAAQASENQDDIAREQKSRTRMQVVVIIMTYLTLLGVMAVLKTQFIDVMAELATSSGGAASAAGFATSVDTELLSLMFFHAVTVQAILSGVICGYMRESDLLSGVKYVIGLMTVALAVWVVVG